MMLPLVKAFMQWKTRPGVIKKALADKKFPVCPPPPGSEELRVACAQMELISARNISEYVDWLYQPLLEAQRRGNQLFLYPEYVTLPLLGLLPVVDEEDGNKIDPGEVFRFVAPFLSQVYHKVFSGLAREAGIYIAAGSMFAVQKDKLYNTAHLFDSEGKLILTQRKMNLVPLESQWGVETGSELEVVEIDGGWRLAMPVCMDATYFEIFRLAGARGAHLVLVPIADINPDYSEHMALRGVWARVQEEPVFGIKSALVGDFFGFKFTGKAGIYAPGEVTSDGEGVIAESQNPEQGNLVQGKLCRSLLEKARAKKTSPPGELYRDYLTESYENLLKRK